jgi:hypothetical protein
MTLEINLGDTPPGRPALGLALEIHPWEINPWEITLGDSP